MAASTFSANALTDARAALAKAKRRADRLRGNLLTMLYQWRADLPSAVRYALARVDEAEHAIADCAADVTEAARAEGLNNPERAARMRELHRISTLVAQYVVGAEIVSNNPGESFPSEWQIEADETHSKRRAVPNYAGDISCAWSAEGRLPLDRFDAYSRFLAHEVTAEAGEASPMGYARASAMARSRAMLRAVGVNPDVAIVAPSWVSR